MTPVVIHTSGTPAQGVKGDAWHSADGRFRWLLRWEWGAGPCMVFVGLNPSTADAFTSDHTARRAADFARREGCGGMAWVNLVPFITPYPVVLRGWLKNNPGAGWWQSNDLHVTEAVTGQDAVVVCAWGANAGHPLIEPHQFHMAALLYRLGIDCHALGVTKKGHPAHPLRLSGSAPLLRIPRVMA